MIKMIRVYKANLYLTFLHYKQACSENFCIPTINTTIHNNAKKLTFSSVKVETKQQTKGFYTEFRT